MLKLPLKLEEQKVILPMTNGTDELQWQRI